MRCWLAGAGPALHQTRLPPHMPALSCLLGMPADDSNAFLAAVAAASKDAKANGKGVAVLVPAGRYKITKVLVIDQSYVVLRGKGVSPPACPASSAWTVTGQ